MSSTDQQKQVTPVLAFATNDEFDRSTPPIISQKITPPMKFSFIISPPIQQDDIDIVNIRPLNNLSAFNFDCQQMNAERLHTSSKTTGAAYTHRNIFSPQATIHEKASPQFINPSYS
ncbi:unnamed protein product [Adineta steineri]|uniref:Uncharacterized protein n=1 Tax=Adineta steineri TaxID=433720 RepID=A0A814CTL0_9BILA|nr:unnamed protein product [Adineta steineri]